MTPAVYVGIPTRNRPAFVRTAIQSVLQQTYPHLKVVVSDNDSEPAIAADVRDYVASLGDPRITFVGQSFPDGERGQTLYNFARCDVPYFMVLHDDDRLHPTLVERAVAIMESDQRLAFFSTAQHLIDADGVVMQDDTASYNEWVGRGRLVSGVVDNVLEITLQGGAFSMSGTVFRHAAMARIGFVDPHGGGFPIDMITYMRIGESGAPGYYLDEHLVDYRWHAGQSRVKHQHWTFNQWMIEKYVAQLDARRYSGLAETLRRQLLSIGLCRLGIVRCVADDWASARALFRRAVMTSPRTWQSWVYCAIGHLLPFAIAPTWGARVTLQREPG